jgi:hypothetical protein
MSNDAFVSALRASNQCYLLGSEEDDDAIVIGRKRA